MVVPDKTRARTVTGFGSGILALVALGFEAACRFAVASRTLIAAISAIIAACLALAAGFA